MKIIKVCGRRTGVLTIVGSCFLATAVPAMTGCAAPERIQYRQVLYKATYNYLRAAECHNAAEQQLAYEPCIKSYADDFESYRKLREQYVRNHRSNS